MATFYPEDCTKKGWTQVLLRGEAKFYDKVENEEPSPFHFLFSLFRLVTTKKKQNENVSNFKPKKIFALSS